MHVNELTISSHRVLKDVHIRFSVPENGRNAVNVIAGVNGTGKTSILELFVQASSPFSTDFRDTAFSFRFTDRWTAEKRTGENGSWAFPTEIPERKENYFSALSRLTKEDAEKKLAGKALLYLPNQRDKIYPIVLQEKVSSHGTKLVAPDMPIMVLPQALMQGLSEQYIKEKVIATERRSREPDPVKRTRYAVTEFNQVFQGTDMLTPLVNLDENQMNRPVFENLYGDHVTIEQLSDGEKQLYGRVTALMSMNPNHAVILIDEPELFLHPRWQYAILDIYRNIGKNNQFIIATHSPYILSKCHYSEMILLKKQGNRIVVEQPDRPVVAQDINSILGIMEADFMPRETLERHRQYRTLVETGQKDTEEGRALLAKILEHEPEQSEFLQRIRFYEELNS